MKELKDYRDEIFRRSEEKKRQLRKKRRIAFGVGIPLCLCAVLTVAVIPLIPMGMKGAMASDMEAIYDNGMILEDAEITVQTFRVTDPEQVNRALILLDGGFLLQKDEDSNNAVADQVMPESYRLILELSDGSTLIYQVSGDYAYCETTDEAHHLSSGLAEALYELVTNQHP